MRNFFNGERVLFFIYILSALIGIWFLTKLWVPEGYAIVGHDSGLALNAGNFLQTRLFAWDDRVDFGTDNSPHFGSIILHSIDYALSLISGQPYAGNQVAAFFWIVILFTFSLIFSYSLRNKLGKIFAYIFPFFMTFNFFIFQSLFILERAKYELVCVVLLFLTLGIKVLFDSRSSVLRYSIIFSLVFSVFNGGGWFGLPLYGGLLVTGLTYVFFSLFFAIKEKDRSYFVRSFVFCFLSLTFFIFLNLYSILPFVSTLINSDYAKVIDAGTISGGREWLAYVSRGSFFINLFRFQGVPEWYLTGGFPNVDFRYASLYLTNAPLILVSFLMPIVSLLGLLFAKEKSEKYIICLFVFLLLMSMFFTAGTNSPLGFIYIFLYEKIPGFSIFRSAYYKFAGSFSLSYAAILAYSTSKLWDYFAAKVRLHLRLNVNKSIFLGLFIILVSAGWFSYNLIVFDRKNIFSWQPDKSTLVEVPEYVYEFDSWIAENEFDGKALIVPALDGDLGNDSLSWGYWSLSTAQSVLFTKGAFVSNDSTNTRIVSSWVNGLYSLLLRQDAAFFKLSERLGINYIFFRDDFTAEDNSLKEKYAMSIKSLADRGEILLVKKIGPWSLYKIGKIETDLVFSLSSTVNSVSKDHLYLPQELAGTEYGSGPWVNSENVNNDLKKVISHQFYHLVCDSCNIENLGKYSEFPAVRILPNSPLYPLKKKLNEKALTSTTDKNTKLAAYLGLVMTKLSEIRSMYDLTVDKKYIGLALRDMNDYLKNADALISENPQLKTNFYFVSRVYETINPVQKYFRDYVYSSDYGSERPELKEEILEVLWQSAVIKKQFDGLTADGGKWSLEKVFNVDSPDNEDYEFLIDEETLPGDNEGGRILPSKILLGVENKELNISRVENNRWIFVNESKISNNDRIRMIFPSLPNILETLSYEQVDFPIGKRGCLVGKINNFNQNRNYNLEASSLGPSVNLRLLIRENDKSSAAPDGFLKGEIETDISLNPGSNYKYIYAPSKAATDPRIYLCRYDANLPEKIDLSAHEIFTPAIYAIKNNVINQSASKITFNKIDPTSYSVKTDRLKSDMILIFNQTFSKLWVLSDDSGTILNNHFVVDGYANGWLLKGDGQYNLTLNYRPQGLFKKGLVISTTTLLLMIAIYFLRPNRKKKNENKEN